MSKIWPSYGMKDLLGFFWTPFSMENSSIMFLYPQTTTLQPHFRIINPLFSIIQPQFSLIYPQFSISKSSSSIFGIKCGIFDWNCPQNSRIFDKMSASAACTTFSFSSSVLWSFSRFSSFFEYLLDCFIF